MRARRSPPKESRPTERESVGFRRRREKRQRVEAFLAGKPLVVGVDLAKRTHAVWLTGRDLVPIERFTVHHSHEGVAILLERAERARAKHGFDRVLVFMEPTSHFWRNVANALEQRGVAYRTVATVAVDRQREIAHLTYAKGDYRDAELIARLGVEGHWLVRVLEQEPLWFELAALTREHEALLAFQIRERQRVRAFLELALPEFTGVFKDPFGVTAREVLRRLSSPAVTTFEEIVERAKTLRADRRLYRGKARSLAALLEAGPSYGVERALVAAFVRVGLAVERFDLLEHQRERVCEQLLERYQRTPHARWLDTIPGIDPVSHALVLGLVGDPLGYDRGTCLAKMAGTEPRENHSGDGEGSHSISRRGIPAMRHVLFRIVSGLMLANTEFSAYMKRLGTREKNPLSHHQALVAAGNNTSGLCTGCARTRPSTTRPGSSPPDRPTEQNAPTTWSDPSTALGRTRVSAWEPLRPLELGLSKLARRRTSLA
jgi:transposase